MLYIALCKYLESKPAGLNLWDLYEMKSHLTRQGKYFISLNPLLSKSVQANLQDEIKQTITNIDVSLQSTYIASENANSLMNTATNEVDYNKPIF